jgi:hypothetical protein
MKIESSFRDFVRTYFAIAATISAMAIYQTQLQTQALVKIRTRYKWVILMLVFAANAATGVYLFLRPKRFEAIGQRIKVEPAGSAAGKIAGALLLLLPLPALWYARWDFYGDGLEAFFRLLWLFWWLALVQTAGIRLITRMSWTFGLALVVVLDGMLAQAYTLALPVSAFPFSMGWSEASRFYYASLVFARSIYGEGVPLSVWHGSRYLLLAIPFLIKGLPIWGARLWQVLLWLAISGATSWSIVRRQRLGDRRTVAVLVGWFFLFLFQGSVYYHLQVCVLFVFLGVSREHRWRSLVAVIVASFWAGMSRLNWFPVPAMLAIALYLLEEPVGRGAAVWRYVRIPILWGVSGLIAASTGQAFYIAISHNTNLEAFGSSLTSALLLYRWLPSATNPIGIIPGVLIASLPLWALLLWTWRSGWRSMHPVRWVGLLAMLLILLMGGLVVSSKIGGGGDLHNMDAYLVLLGLTGIYFMCRRVAQEPEAEGEFAAAPWSTLALVFLVPVAFSLLRVGSPFAYDRAAAAADLYLVRQGVQSYNKAGPVLFMYERQLLTFGMIPGVPLVPDYEVVSLMEMAISGNEPYLMQFYHDLANHRFAAIVAHPQNLGVETGDFIEESDVWNRLVAQPLLCQYKPAVTFPYSHVQLLVPRARPCTEFPPAVHAP